ncbi:hypothetical protein CRV11_01445 [Candidatus Pantoea edessiphila]|uniref:Lipoprotein n=1 Tax=Candidatus Pantoea edessiphila TaxID=2044610 RepID=A0A2P5SZ40_9GAMM|nr:hypothetical protein [Candidatus Pantoea edessiphila]MBK4775289.1 hypothetical protein [Pantoea sp. Edef]PPI87573.1 hypothetical protein CRV11_01445 [Candidatus Pantoea edessiphila]
MKKLANKIFILIMIFMLTNCNKQAVNVCHAPLGFQEIVISDMQNYNPILPEFYKGLSSNNIKVVEDTPENHKKYPVLVFNDKQSKYNDLQETELSNGKIPPNCEFIFKIKANFKLPGDVVHEIDIDSTNWLCNYLGNFKKKYKMVYEINKHSADLLLNQLFVLYNLNSKVKITELNPKTKPCNTNIVPPVKNKSQKTTEPTHKKSILDQILFKKFMIRKTTPKKQH